MEGGHVICIHADLTPARADIYAYFLRPEKRSAWKPDTISRIHPNFGVYTDDEMGRIREEVRTNSDLFPDKILKLLETSITTNRFPRMKSKELANTFANKSACPDLTPSLPLPHVNTKLYCSQYIPYLNVVERVNT